MSRIGFVPPGGIPDVLRSPSESGSGNGTGRSPSSGHQTTGQASSSSPQARQPGGDNFHGVPPAGGQRNNPHAPTGPLSKPPPGRVDNERGVSAQVWTVVPEYSRPEYADSGHWRYAEPETIARAGAFIARYEPEVLPAGSRFLDRSDLFLDLRKAADRRRAEGAAWAVMPHAVIFTSAAGMGERSGNADKTLAALNGMALAPELEKSIRDWDYIVNWSGFAKGLPPETLLSGLGLDLREGESAEAKYETLLAEAKAGLSGFVRDHALDDRAYHATLLDYVFNAQWSALYGTYIPLFRWTNEYTHAGQGAFLEHLREVMSDRELHPDRDVQEVIRHCLDQYFKRGDEEGWFHLFGWQVGMPEFDKKGNPIEDSKRVGEGHGMLLPYLESSGLMKDLLNRGRHRLLFKNGEKPADDAPALYGAHQLSGKAVAVAHMPFVMGETEGGSGFMVPREHGEQFGVWEMSMLPNETQDAIKKGLLRPEFFNRNAVVIDLRKAEAPTHTGYEEKKRRLKSGICDITHQTPSVAIGTEFQKELKSILKIYTAGPELLNQYWEAQARLAHQLRERSNL